MKAKDLKNIVIPLVLCDKEFKMAFDFNALAELEEVYGELDKAMRSIKCGKGRLKAIQALIYSGIKPRNPKVTMLEVGELLTEILNDENKADYIIDQIGKAISLAMPDKKVNDEEGNKSGE